MDRYALAIKTLGIWTLEDNEIWSVPDVPKVGHDIEKAHFLVGYLITKIRGLACSQHGHVFGMRTLSNPRAQGYAHGGTVSIGGHCYRAFTSTQLFQRPDGSQCDVGILFVCDYDISPIGVGE